jgi:hypothetical protein
MSSLRLDSAALLSTTALTSVAVADIQTLYTVPAGKTCILAFAFIRADADFADNGEFTIGSGAGAIDFVGTTHIDNLDAAGDVILMAPVPSATPAKLKAYAAATVISLDVAVSAAAQTGTCYLFGFLY